MLAGDARDTAEELVAAVICAGAGYASAVEFKAVVTAVVARWRWPKGARDMTGAQ